MLYYTYLHRRASDGQPFYVGKGKGGRFNSRKDRSPYWRHVAQKHGLKAEIVAQWPTEAEAFEHEKFLIWCFRDMGFELCNLTDGGEGKSGWAPTEKTKSLWSKQRTGKGNHRFGKTGNQSALYGRQLSDEHKEKLSVAFKGEKNPMHGQSRTQEVKDKISQKKRGIPQPEKQVAMECIETKQQFCSVKEASLWATGCSNKHPNLIRSAKSGGIKSAYGYHWKYI
jgi:hypothetical protein